MRPTTLAAALMLTASTPAMAQTPAPPPPIVLSDVRPADAASIDGIVAALYDVISGDAGQDRDWNRFLALFMPEGRLIATGTHQGHGTFIPMTPRDYIDRAGPNLVRDGFHEREIARRVERFGRIAHVFSTYEARRASTDAEPFLRGINSIQLFHDGIRWRIVSVYWQAEDPDTPLPPQYLPR